MYKFSMRRAVSDVFPDVKFDLSKFHSIKSMFISPPRSSSRSQLIPKSVIYLSYLTEGYWMQYDNRRKYFIEFANALGFDPLVASNWYGRDAASFDTVCLLFLSCFFSPPLFSSALLSSCVLSYVLIIRFSASFINIFFLSLFFDCRRADRLPGCLGTASPTPSTPHSPI